MYICLYVCMCMCVCVRACVRLCMYVCMYVQVSINATCVKTYKLKLMQYVNASHSCFKWWKKNISLRQNGTNDVSYM